jgi:hypothetical protein
MITNDNLAAAGLILNTIGSILLATSLNSTLQMLDVSIRALEVFKDSLLAEGDIASIENLDKNRERAKKNDRNFLVIGLLMVIIGFILQLLALLKKIH